jgi:hypothetical protein
MKKNLFLLLALCFASNFLFSQNIGDIITLTADVPTTGSTLAVSSNVLGSQMQNSSTNILSSIWSYKVISIDNANSTVQLRALDFKPLKDKTKKKYKKKYGVDKVDLADVYNYKIYTISKADFDSYAQAKEKIEKKERLSFGILTLPFKARPQEDFSFDSEFNLNTTLNIRLKSFADTSVNLQLGGGIGTVGLNTSNADGLSEDEAQDVSTLTLLSGLMLEHKNVQVGLYFGADNINNQSNYKWKSNGNIWFGFGVGYDLFNIAVSEKKNDQSNSQK